MALTDLWHFHPRVRSGEQLTIGERAADRMRNSMGSWPFVFGFVVAMGIWAFVNTALHLGGSGGKHGFDPYPYILLNLFLSMLAGLQGAILLIAAKRADTISAELAKHDYDTNVEADQIVKAIHQLTQEIHAHLGCGHGQPSD